MAAVPSDLSWAIPSKKDNWCSKTLTKCKPWPCKQTTCPIKDRHGRALRVQAREQDLFQRTQSPVVTQDFFPRSVRVENLLTAPTCLALLTTWHRVSSTCLTTLRPLRRKSSTQRLSLSKSNEMTQRSKTLCSRLSWKQWRWTCARRMALFISYQTRSKSVPANSLHLLAYFQLQASLIKAHSWILHQNFRHCKEQTFSTEAASQSKFSSLTIRCSNFSNRTLTSVRELRSSNAM